MAPGKESGEERDRSPHGSDRHRATHPFRALGPGVATALVVVVLFLGVSGDARAAETCAAPLAQLVLVNGNVELLRQGTTRLVGGQLNASLCAGDTVVVHQRSQAALLLNNATTVRLDQGTTVTLSASDDQRSPLLNVVSGAAYVITRTPRPFRVRTPFINANVEGTEFLVEVRRGREPSDDQECPIEVQQTSDLGVDRITVLEGRVSVTSTAAANAPITLASGESAVASSDQGPTRDPVVRPRDAVLWTLHVPSVLGTQSSVPPVVRCAAHLLAVGRLDEAKVKLDRLVGPGAAMDARDASVGFALLATIAVAENDKEAADRHSQHAVELDPRSAPAWIARSYAQQARFRIADALASVEQADAIAPDAARKARLAELRLAVGDVAAAVVAAQEATKADPQLARAHVALGFVELVRIDLEAARQAFEEAIRLGPADPLARLGLGLTLIRRGDLAGGRESIEIAAVLDTEDSLIRSYLGKAYYEEKRDRLAESQLELAKSFDPKDPTPWLYGAILQQSGNRPVDALASLDRSIELNDNRAVYRSRLLLDQDQAARMVSLARTYRMLGFDQLGLLEAVKSLSLDASDSSAHRFLADAYSGQIRSEAARVSELFQAQLRQPLGLNTIPPQLLADPRQLVEVSGPVQPSLHEFTPLFNRNQLSIRLDGVAGNFNTVGDQFFVSGLQDRLAYSVGQYHYETEGFRTNNDQKRDIYSAFAHVAVAPSVRLQLELRDDRMTQGDLAVRFDPEDFSVNRRDELQQQSARLGAIVALDARSNVVLSAIQGRSKERLYSKLDPSNFFEDRERLTATELQYMLAASSFHLTTGIADFRNRVVLEDPTGSVDDDENGRSIYALAVLTALPWGLRPQLGVSFDTFDRGGSHVSRTDPKLGLLWAVSPNTTIRAAAFRTIKRSFDANQTLQPSQIFGFNQFFDDPNGTLSRGAGAALHQRFSSNTFAGVEWTRRDSQVPGFPGDPYSDWQEKFAKAYVYQVLNRNAAMTLDLQYERLKRPEENTGNEGFTDLRTVFVPVAVRLHWPTLWSAALQATYVKQKARWLDSAGDPVEGTSSFTLLDANVAYQLPGRMGTVSLEARNLLDRRFRYQEIDVFSSPRVAPRRSLLVRVSVAF